MSDELFGRIAVIGMAGRFPGAKNLDQYWNNLVEGLETITHFQDDDLLEAGVDPGLLEQDNFVKAGAELEDATLFDAAFFGFSPAEATLMDPQFRVFLELAWHALEDSGYDPGQSEARIGVFASSSMATYIHRLMDKTGVANPEGTLRARIYNDKDFLATLAAYKLTGPAFNVQTACSSSLVAVHLAIQSLLSGECDMALAGGVTIAGNQRTGYMHYEGGINAPDGHCRPFDNAAGGTVPGNGAGLVVLKKLEDALQAGDHIEAVILGTALNNDGHTKMSFTAPSVQGQSEVIGEALLVADIPAETIDMLEAHGTGTAVGDPIEIEALTDIYRTQTQATAFCGVGSVKGNIGHLDAAAGIAGLLKCILALKHKKMPGTLHFETPNQRIPFPQTPFYVLSETQAWPQKDHPRRAAVSSFGVGGTNVHAILEQAPALASQQAEGGPQCVVLSARNSEALTQARQSLKQTLSQQSNTSLADLAFTLQVGRKAMPYRHACVVETSADLLAALDKPTPNIQALTSPNLVFMFPGQGTQFPGMGRIHYAHCPEYATQLDQCLDLINDHAQLDLRPLLFADFNDQQAATRLNQTRFAQPALFCVSYALAKQWQAWGIHPEATIGLSIGEYVAACLSGIFSLEECLKLVCLRGRLMNDMQPGSMMAIQASSEWLSQALPQNLDLTAINSPNSCVVGGPDYAVQAFSETLQQQGVAFRKLHTSHAFHSSMMQPMLEAFQQAVSKCKLQHPNTPMISNLTGQWLTREQALDPAYWAQHLAKPVQFRSGLETLLAAGDRLFLEIGPGGTLGSLLNQQRGESNPVCVGSLARPGTTTVPDEGMLRALSRLWAHGIAPDWHQVHQGQPRRRVSLPGYPFQGVVYEPDSPLATEKPTALSKSDDIASWFYLPSWQQAPLLGQTPLDSEHLGKHWLVFESASPLFEQLAKALPADVVLTRAEKGETFVKTNAHHYQLQAEAEDDYATLFGSLPSPPDVIVHGWMLDHELATPLDQGSDDAFYAQLFTAKAIRKQGWQHPIKWLYLSNQMQRVLGDETVLPHQALGLGPVKVIPKEHPNIHCAAVDLSLKDSSVSACEALATQILHEVANGLVEPVTALRGRLRWRLDYQETTLDSRNLDVREGGTYLLTGGFGGVGFSLASALASTKPVNLVLTSRKALPEEDTWDTHFQTFNSSPESLSQGAQKLNINWQDDLAALETQETALNQSLAVADLPQKEALSASLDKLCAAFVLQYFQDCGVHTAPGQNHHYQGLRDRLGILPKFEKFYDFFVRTLQQEGLVEVAGDQFQFAQAASEFGQAAQQAAQVKQAFPEIAAVVDLLSHCTAHYPQALRGDIEAIGVLYPEGKTDLLEKTTRETALFSRDNLYQQLLAHWVTHLLATKKQGPLRILEVGGGNGNLTRVLTEQFANSDITYTFTDLGKSFVLKAEALAQKQGHHFMDFSVFDITRTPDSQGLEHHAYDLVIGFDVVHATRDIETSTENIRALLAPGGMMCLVESVQTHRWVDMVWGLAEGWWHFEDYHLRPNSPLMAPEQWETALNKHFGATTCFPRHTAAREKTDFTLVMAQQHLVLENPGFLEHQTTRQQAAWQLQKSRIEQVKHLRSLGAQVMTRAVDVTHAKAIADLVEEVEQTFGPIHGAVHAAGLLEDQLIQMKTRASAARVLAPKVTGSLVLADALSQQPLDFLMLCSSLAAVGGQLTQVDHCAACSFQDALARARRDSMPIVALNWGVWREVGLAAQLASDQLVGLKQAREAYGMTPEEGAQAFARALTTSQPQVVISTTPLDQTFAKEFELEVLAHAETAQNKLHQRPDLEVPYQAPESALDTWLCQKWGQLLGIDRIGIHDNFFELGADSLLGITLVNELQRELDEIVHITALLDAPTVAQLGNYLTQHYPQAISRITGSDDRDTQQSSAEVTEPMLDQFERIILGHTPPEPPSSRQLDTAAFVISAPRSGSTLLRVMLGGHPQLFAPPEMDLLPFQDLAQRRDALIQDPSMLEGATEAVMAAKGIRAEEAEKHMQDFQDQKLGIPDFYAQLQQWVAPKLLVEKSPSYALNPATLNRADRYFPSAKFIHLLRHPYGMIHSYEQARLDLLFSAEMRQSMPFTRRQLAEMTWILSERNIRAFFRTLAPERHHLVRYEDLVQAPQQTMEALCSFLGIEFHPDVLQPYQEKQKRMTGGLHANSRMLGDVKFHQHQGINASRAESWRDHFQSDFLGAASIALAADSGYQLLNQFSEPQPDQTLEELVSSLSGDALDDMLKEMMQNEKATP